ncbi:type II toxin-antitoxin system VapB15 family antitoxin [Niabella ginsengisoli]|uniref:type II toxin-antitoxin system VapB15 family antitoxin n=1 Tax=Niabella ginsengisoli TaxID=522298 RepID=UPI00374CB8FF
MRRCFFRKFKIKKLIMKTALQIDVSFEQILSMVRQLPTKQKLKLTKELEKEVTDSKLTRLLKSFKTNDIDIKTITEEAETVRREIYDKQKH